MRRQQNVSMKELIDKNKEDLLNDKEALHEIEQKLDEKYSKKI